MVMIQFVEKFNDIVFDISFEDKINLLSGVSGEGKTFAFRMTFQQTLS